MTWVQVGMGKISGEGYSCSLRFTQTTENNSINSANTLALHTVEYVQRIRTQCGQICSLG